MTRNDQLSMRFMQVNRHIDNACVKAGRSRHEVHLLAVSKGQSADAIHELYQMGQRDFGENYAGEMSAKQALLASDCPDIRWHFIGQIQTNKAKKIACSSMVHSIANQKQAESLARQMVSPRILPVLLQVNLDQASHRGGVDAGQLAELYRSTSQLDGLRVLGLMAVLPLQTRGPKSAAFEEVRMLRSTLENKFDVVLPELSMGMSDDFEDAIMHGSTWVRLGTALFGSRGE